MRLPRSLDELTGLRAARWSRESTTGQFDAFGPEAQREQQDRAIERYGLTDTGIAWTVAHSGRTVGNTDQFRDMLARAGRDYDVLVVGYVSRFARDLRTAVNARHDLHAAGAAILFADERILTSDEDAWDSWAREAVEAESYSRKLGRRIREGYAAKRRRLGNPGGRVPYGFTRSGYPPVLVADDTSQSTVRDLFAMAVGGITDRQCAVQSALPLHTVRGILTNPIYIGLLRDGSPAAVEPLIDRETWDRVQRIRGSRARTGGHHARRTYALPMLSCAACGRRLIGDSGRYRHLDPCPEFTAARRRLTFKNRLTRRPGQSYPTSLYESLVPAVLDKVALSTSELIQSAAVYRDVEQPVDEVALRRIQRDRERALARYATDRDTASLEAAMRRLDSEEEALRQPVDRPDWTEVLDVLRDLPQLWREAEPAERRAIATTHFRRVLALGARTVTFDFMDGVQTVVSVGARGKEASVTVTRTPWSVRRVG